MIETLTELSTTLTLDVPSGPSVVTLRDEYLAASPSDYSHHIDECNDYIAARGNCWSCGATATSTSDVWPPSCTAHPPMS